MDRRTGGGAIRRQQQKANDSLPNKAGSYYLTQDVDLGGSSWDFPSGTTSLCLDGHSITSEHDDGTIVLAQKYQTLYLFDDHSGDSAGVISSEKGDGVLVKEEGAHFNMYGGKISNCDDYGVNLDEDDTCFNMYSGEISNCYSGVSVDSDAVFMLHNGSIHGNTDCGVASYGTVVIENGSVTNNKTGVYINSSANGISLQGSNISPRITGNTEHNLLLNRSGNLKIRIKEGTTISGDARIGVYPTNGTAPVAGIFTDGLADALPQGKTAADIFTSDDSNYDVGTSNGEAKLVNREPVAKPTFSPAEGKYDAGNDSFCKV